jgi:IS5 family transposase
VQKKLEAMPNEVRWYIAKRRKPIRVMAECWQKDLALAFEKGSFEKRVGYAA